jgi:hypothetical protein
VNQPETWDEYMLAWNILNNVESMTKAELREAIDAAIGLRRVSREEEK